MLPLVKIHLKNNICYIYILKVKILKLLLNILFINELEMAYHIYFSLREKCIWTELPESMRTGDSYNS
jgi:hypothetical protein